MKVDGHDYRAIWWEGDAIGFIDQRLLPHRFESSRTDTVEGVAAAITDMAIRGAPTIGVMGAYGLALAARNGVDQDQAYSLLIGTRPTAINLKVGLDTVKAASPEAGQMLEAARTHDESEVAAARAIGRHGSSLLDHGSRVLTHCNAGWLAAQDLGDGHVTDLRRRTGRSKPLRVGL